ncbi:nucleotidyltransferase domain-containing protein [Nocardioides marmorisolisilvae]|uniref:ArsR family transcriptional regulator n=1 Tax=Nocardioides marmorisolisilvae TaxID=1542737 RepID=A0A3N0DX11_9ACTN|nr:nucleotidyltransferase domain-containing protein [Nocardioides marmorisolisilvae]RNL80158.1 ArsR family transcriptional regulator [Nocardioides marmorisolisilvae]
MSLVTEYREARRGEETARLRRLLALRALVADGLSQREIADELGVSQPAVSQQLKNGPELTGVHPQDLLEAAAPVLKAMAAERAYERLAVFGSVARREARQDSDIDLIVEAPPETSSFDFVAFKMKIEEVLGREIDLIDYGGLKPRIDDDIRQDAVLL